MKLILVLLLAIVTIQANDDLLKQFSNGNIKFSANVYKEILKKNSGNFLVCPMSVETVFALMHAGAAHKTANEISNAFNFPHDSASIQNIFKQLSPKLQHNGEYNLSSANKVYIKDTFKIKDSFKKVATEMFNAEVEKIDFEKKKDAVHNINSWVEEKTYNKIQNLISTDDINELTRMILVNAMYFKGKWTYPFFESLTKKRDFYLNKNDKINMDMMENTKHYNYHECKETNSKYLEMRFWGSDVTMVIILPNEKDGLPHLEENLESVLKVPNYTNEKVYVRLPKFEMGSKINFKPILEQLGILNAFKKEADFSGINADPNEALHIDKVIQKTYIKVEEQGTTAAAATAVISAVATSALIGPPAPPKEFFVDHPFIYVLKNSEGIMFVGRFVNKEN